MSEAEASRSVTRHYSTPIRWGQVVSLLRWIDGTPLSQHIEPYRARLFDLALDTFEPDGRPRYNLIVCGRAKKNWKTADLVAASLFALVSDSPAGHDSECYLLANDGDQARDDLSLAKKIVKANPDLAYWLKVKANAIERRDGRGFLEVLPAGDVVGQHGKSYRFVGYDEIHGYRTWDVLEAMQPDPHRLDAQQWITSYASLFHRPGVPLFDLIAQGKAGTDPRLLFSWYAADFTTDPAFADLPPEQRANPSIASWGDSAYPPHWPALTRHGRTEPIRPRRHALGESRRGRFDLLHDAARLTHDRIHALLNRPLHPGERREALKRTAGQRGRRAFWIFQRLYQGKRPTEKQLLKKAVRTPGQHLCGHVWRVLRPCARRLPRLISRSSPSSAASPSP